MIKEKIDKYYEEKQKELENENKDEVKIINKSLEHREELKFIQSLDKSRSGKNVIPLIDQKFYIKNKLLRNLESEYFYEKNKKKNKED